MIDKQFDDILKRKLNEMTEAGDSDWSVFEQKLDNSELTDSAVQNKFDNSIKQKLAGVATSLSSDWSTFEHMLDEDQLTDAMLDEKVSKEMNNMRAPYRQDHWELLHDSLEYQKQRNNSIVGYKVIELSLLLILLLSANNLYKYLPSTFEVEKPIIYATLEDDRRHETKVSTNETSTPVAQTREVSIQSNRRTEIRIDNQELIAAPTLIKKVDLVAKPTATSEKHYTPINIAASQRLDVVEQSTKESTKNMILVNAAVIDELYMSGISTQEPYLHASLEGVDGYNIKNILPANEIEKSIFVYAGIDNNLVNSPFDDVYDTEGFRTYGIGYSAGIEYGIKKGKKEFSLGLGYSNRSYEPRIIEELSGNLLQDDILYETSLDRIEFNIISVSAGMKYVLAETDNWALDLGIGASANVVVNSNYSIETDIIKDGQFVSSRLGRKPYSSLDDKPLHDGFFERGSLQENIYLTTDISFGLHRQLNESTTFTLRPEYSAHSFSNGIGPNNDLINNLSLNLGVKYIL